MRQNLLMAKQTVLLFFLSALCVGDSNISDSSCGDWKPYKDEKCVQIFEESGLFNYENAESFCKKHDESHLILIDSEEKQNFLENWLKFNKIVDNVWIGFKHGNNNYEWNTGTEIHYTNWRKGSPKNDSDSCVHINTDESEFGKWSNVPCNKKNLVVCEKNQELSWIKLPTKVIKLQKALNKSEQTLGKLEAVVSRLENELQKLRNEIQISQTDLLLKNTELEARISNAVDNAVPVGFIYSQLPNEKSPQQIWPSTEWKDISSDFAGVFFRVIGGNAASFGSRQSDHSPRLVSVQRHYGQGSYQKVSVYANGYRSDIIDADDVSIGSSQGISFTVSSGEVRPVNMAIKIWKRVK